MWSSALTSKSLIPPGITQLDPSGHIWLEISVTNHGRTPARVTDVQLKPIVVPHGDPLPAAPDYSVEIKSRNVRAFLVSDDQFFHSRFYRITPDEMSNVKALIFDLYMIGFVDYIDQFETHHRGGYARQYHPMLDVITRYGDDEEKFEKRNNLTVVAQDGYNYDRVRARGEGLDWNE